MLRTLLREQGIAASRSIAITGAAMLPRTDQTGGTMMFGVCLGTESSLLKLSFRV